MLFYYIQDYRVNVSNINFLSSCEFKETRLQFITNINKHQHTNVSFLKVRFYPSGLWSIFETFFSFSMVYYFFNYYYLTIFICVHFVLNTSCVLTHLQQFYKVSTHSQFIVGDTGAQSGWSDLPKVTQLTNGIPEM